MLTNDFMLSGMFKNTNKLQNGKYVFFNFEASGSKLHFIIDNLNTSVASLFEDIPFDNNKDVGLDLYDPWISSLGILKGKFVMSEDGMPFFDVTNKDKPHLLIKIKWDGSLPFGEKSGGLNKNNLPEETIFSEFNQIFSTIGIDFIVLPIKSDFVDKICSIL